jgi:hypothetical protein
LKEDYPVIDRDLRASRYCIAGTYTGIIAAMAPDKNLVFGLRITFIPIAIKLSIRCPESGVATLVGLHAMTGQGQAASAVAGLYVQISSH